MINWKILTKILLLYFCELFIIYLLYNSFIYNSTIFGSLLVVFALYNTFYLKYFYQKEVLCDEYEKNQNDRLKKIETSFDKIQEKIENIFSNIEKM